MTRESNGPFLSASSSAYAEVAFSSQGSAPKRRKNQQENTTAALQKHPEPGYLFDRFYTRGSINRRPNRFKIFCKKEADRTDAAVADRLLLAFFHSKQNNDVAAIEEFGRALKSDSQSAVAWFYKAQAESRTLDFDAAIADLNAPRP